MSRVGIIGGSGLYDIEGIKNLREEIVKTPFGSPSDPYKIGTLEGTEVVFLPRHAKGHRVSPTEINSRANIFGMKKLGVDAIVSVSACGSLRENIKPLDFVVPDQFVDRTHQARPSTFFSGGIVAHVAMAHPVDEQIARILIDSVKKVGVTVHEKGTYINMEGPQFATRAESNLYRQWGMDIIGMTNIVEAKLSMEAEIAYATLAAVTDYDCWYDGHDEVTVEMVIANLQKNIQNAKAILKLAIPQVGKMKTFRAQDALKYAIMTNPKMIPAKLKKDLKILIGKYVQ